MDESVVFVAETHPKPPRRNRRDPTKAPSVTVDLTRDSNEFQPSKTQNRPTQEQNENSLNCPICFESLINKPTQVTKCGHLFCKSCIKNLPGQSDFRCPRCRAFVFRNMLRNVYL